MPSIFSLPSTLVVKSGPLLVAADEAHFAAIAAGPAALERDQEVPRVTARLRALSRFGLDLASVAWTPSRASPSTGRLGLAAPGAAAPRRLTLPAAEPFIGATRRQETARETRREEMADVVSHLIEHDDSEMMLMSMLRGADLQGALDEGEVPDVDELAGPFAHVVVDEAQELTDAEWQVVLARCPSRSLTVVGDRAQAGHRMAESWEQRLERVGLPEVRHASLTISYRTPEEEMAEDEPAIGVAVPDANVPGSVRRSGVPVHHGSVDEPDELVARWEADHPDGTGVVIGLAAYAGTQQVRSLSARPAKGQELDLVVLVDPGSLAPVDRYVAMTRATQRLVVLEP